MKPGQIAWAAAFALASGTAAANVTVTTVGPVTTWSENFNGGTSFSGGWVDVPFTSDDHLILTVLDQSSSYSFASATALSSLTLSFWYSVPFDHSGTVVIAGSGPTLLADTPGNAAQYALNNPGPDAGGFGAFDAFFTQTLLNVNPGSYTVTFATTGGVLDSLKVDDVTITAVAAVPEPETYALMLAGLGATGFIARRRRQASARR